MYILNGEIWPINIFKTAQNNKQWLISLHPYHKHSMIISRNYQIFCETTIVLLHICLLVNLHQSNIFVPFSNHNIYFIGKTLCVPLLFQEINWNVGWKCKNACVVAKMGKTNVHVVDKN